MEEVVNESEEKVLVPEVQIDKLLPPVYSRQLKLFGIVVWSDSRQLDDDMFFDRVTARINSELAKEVLTLRARIQR